MKPYFLLIACLSGRCILAQTATPDVPLGGVQTSANVSPADRELIDRAIQTTVTVAPSGNAAIATVNLQNLSDRTVTAFCYAVAAQYDDGKKTFTSRAMDILSVTVARSAAPAGTTVRGPGTLRSYETFHDSFGLPLAQDGSLPVLVSVEITSLIFWDRRAAGDSGEIQRALDWRKGSAAILGDVLTDVKAAQQDRQVQAANTAQERAARLRSLIDNRIDQIQNGPSRPGSSARLEVDRLKTFSRSLAGGSDFAFQHMLEDWEAGRSALVEHSTLEVSK